MTRVQAPLEGKWLACILAGALSLAPVAMPSAPAAGVGQTSAPARTAKNAMLQLCLDTAADGSAVYPTDVFPATSKGIAAAYRLGDGENFSKGTFSWIAVDVNGAAPPNYEIAKGDLPLGRQRAGVVRLTGLQKPMPPGKYRLDVTVDGHPWKSAPFSVAPPVAVAAVPQPLDLVPLTAGKTWTYAFVQEPGAGARVTIPGITPDAEGKLRATVTISAAAAEPAGMRMDLRRNGVLVFQEWWRLGPSGLVATQRRQPDSALVALDPPQTFLPFPLQPPQAWDYAPKDGSYKQVMHLWGPVPLTVAGAATPGYVVLTNQPGLSATTAERQPRGESCPTRRPV